MTMIMPVNVFEVLITVVGYLPAEHIETPTERLARLNKHRNIDVCIISPQAYSELIIIF